jgi:hypothetical protein
MFGIDRLKGGSINNTNAGREFWRLIDNADAKNNWDWNDKGGLEYLNTELNNYEYMLTFDDKTYLTTISALCGTKAIILNDKIRPYKYRELNPTQMYGIAYGLNDITWANNTIDMVENHLIELEKNDKQTVKEFVKYWENKLL